MVLVSSSSPAQVTFEVSIPSSASEQRAQLAAWIYPPMKVSSSQSPWIWCIPGGTYTGRAYYNRQVPSETYSMAHYLASHDIGCVIMDNPGTGDNQLDHLSLSGEQLTPEWYAALYNQVVEIFRQRLTRGTLLASLSPAPEATIIGCGHSMGGCILSATQGTYHSFDAVILLGWTQGTVDLHSPTPFTLPADAVKNGFLSPAASRRQGVHELFFSERVPADLIEADDADAVSIPVGMLGILNTPGVVAEHAARITTPVLLSFGEIDVSQDPRAETTFYRSAEDIMLLIQNSAHHCANFEPSRFVLWSKIADWCQGMKRGEEHELAAA
jgi:alpha-beta hydrolase superfamily lysophospholipase